MSGVTIGDGAVLGACALVTRNVPPYAIVGGNPAEIIRYRFSDAVITRLLEIRWWSWPIERVRAVLPALLTGDTAEFFALVQGGSRAQVDAPQQCVTMPATLA